ncbi:MAG: hypothetical protein ACLFWM_13575 [Actinomycetota bacterium]
MRIAIYEAAVERKDGQVVVYLNEPMAAALAGLLDKAPMPGGNDGTNPLRELAAELETGTP